MSNKLDALDFVTKLNVPTLGTIRANSFDELINKAMGMQFPLIVKAAAGGGGKGMRIVNVPEELPNAIESASREANAYFGNPQIFIERYIQAPRHIEVQILADDFGNIIHLYDRECTIQRRHQKIIEEAPSPTLSNDTRNKILETALKIGREMGYNNAGTLEFLLDEQSNFYFLEMNTRLQVEHPVTEAITGIDIVKEQINIASGLPLSFKQEEIRIKGHAIESRVYAEDAFNSFMPSSGNILLYNEPAASGLRIDAAIDRPVEISADYDPLISKVTALGANREKARQSLVGGLSEYIIHGIITNIDYLKEVLRNKNFITNNLSTHFCEIEKRILTKSYQAKLTSIEVLQIITTLLVILYLSHDKGNLLSETWQTLGHWRQIMNTEFDILGKKYKVAFKKTGDNAIQLSIDDKTHQFSVEREGHKITVKGQNISYYAYATENSENVFLTLSNSTLCIKKPTPVLLEKSNDIKKVNGDDNFKVLAPLNGKVVKVNVKSSEKVNKGDIMIVIESMKMENYIVAPREGLVNEIFVNTGDRVSGRDVLAIMS
jgi:acetyl/propionyl-CoA carboxylase alpha subunit